MPNNDTDTYELEGKQYVVPKGTSLDEVDQYIKGQSQTQPVPAPRDAEGPRPTEPLPGDEAEAAGMQTIAKEHPYALGGSMLAGVAPAAALAGPETIGA